MKTLIANNATEGHIISKYSFKVLGYGTTSAKPETATSVLVENPNPGQEQEIAASKAEENATESTSNETGSRDELVESLLKKTDEISSNFIKIQMKLEDQETEFKTTLEVAKKEAYA